MEESGLWWMERLLMRVLVLAWLRGMMRRRNFVTIDRWMSGISETACEQRVRDISASIWDTVLVALCMSHSAFWFLDCLLVYRILDTQSLLGYWPCQIGRDVIYMLPELDLQLDCRSGVFGVAAGTGQG